MILYVDAHLTRACMAVSSTLSQYPCRQTRSHCFLAIAVSDELPVQGDGSNPSGQLALLVGIEFLEPKLRYMRSIEY